MVKKFVMATAVGLALSATQAQATNLYDLRFFQVDDDMKAFITNSAFAGQLVLEKPFGPDYGYVDISSFVRPGLNTLTLQLFNGPAGYTYGYDFRINGTTYSSGACGTFNHGGCDNDSYAQGLVWTKNVAFDVPGSVPEPSTWSIMIAGFGLVGAAMRRRRAAVVTFA